LLIFDCQLETESICGEVYFNNITKVQRRKLKESRKQKPKLLFNEDNCWDGRQWNTLFSDRFNFWTLLISEIFWLDFRTSVAGHLKLLQVINNYAITESKPKVAAARERGKNKINKCWPSERKMQRQKNWGAKNCNKKQLQVSDRTFWSPLSGLICTQLQLVGGVLFGFQMGWVPPEWMGAVLGGTA